MKQVLQILKWFAVLIIVVAVAAVVYFKVKIDKPFAPLGEEKVFTIIPGVNTKQIAAELSRQGFVDHPVFFEIYIYLKRASKRIQAGSYLLGTDMSVRDIAQKLVSGDAISDAVKLTVTEGWNTQDIAEALQQSGVISAGEFLAAINPSPIEGGPAGVYDEFDFLSQVPASMGVEGFLFPDTYLIAKDATGRDIVRKLLQNFDRKVTPQLQQQAEQRGKSLYEIVTLASIIEREVGRNVKKGEKLSPDETGKLSEERRLVASVFYNRLKIGMALESDATVRYITNSSSSRATLEETKIDSPYNTYKYRGLPPGPIANPSLDSIEAAISPAESDYLFFLTAPDGTAYFARTLDEHIANRNKYLE